MADTTTYVVLGILIIFIGALGPFSSFYSGLAATQLGNSPGGITIYSSEAAGSYGLSEEDFSSPSVTYQESELSAGDSELLGQVGADEEEDSGGGVSPSLPSFSDLLGSSNYVEAGVTDLESGAIEVVTEDGKSSVYYVRKDHSQSYRDAKGLVELAAWSVSGIGVLFIGSLFYFKVATGARS